MTATCWDSAGRDVVPDLTARGAPSDVGAAILFALLESDGASWAPPYDEIRNKLGIRRKVIEPEREEQADSRLRTYFALFRGLGLLYEKNGLLHVTGAGRQVSAVLREMFEGVDAAARETSRATRWRLARVAVPTLARYQLRNPKTANEYSPETDIFPLWAIWRAMRSLENRLHWEELGRVLTRCLRMSDLPGAITKIQEARNSAEYNPDDIESATAHLGDRCPDLHDDQQDRMIVWLSRAGFKDLLIEHKNREDGFRYLQDEFIPLIDAALAEPPVKQEFTDPADYFSWVGSAASEWEDEHGEGADDDQMLESIISRVEQFGDRTIIGLVGAAGTGKTRLAFKAARLLAGEDPARVESVQFHAAFTYEEFVGGLSPVEEGLGFHREPGLLLRFNKKALNDPENRYVLVIDELSRADVANVLGELLTYVEYRDRAFQVAGLGQEVRLAKNLAIIVTLNPADRSVVNLDDAVVRRLRMIELGPSTSALIQILDDNGMTPELRDEVVQWFSGLPADVPFGHGVFVGVRTEQDLRNLWLEQLRYYLRRGGLTVYPNSAAVEAGYRWKASSAPRPESPDETIGPQT